jgi:molybdate transport system permease protein
LSYDWEPLLLTFRLAGLTTLILFILGIPLAYWLAFTKFRFKAVVETLVSMPLVLPPTVLGFYLLLTLSPQHFIGKTLKEYFDLQLVFTFEGLVLGSVIFSLPFMVHPVQAGLQNFQASLIEASHSLGKSKWLTLIKVLLPNIKPSLLTGAVLSFAHTVGEFGMVLMLGGNIPGQTEVASIAIFEKVEAQDYSAAHFYSVVLFLVSFCVLLIVYVLNKKLLKPVIA